MTAVNQTHGEVATPVATPSRLVVTLNGVNQFLNVVRDSGQEVVLVRRVGRRGGQQLDNRTQRTLFAQDRAVVNPV